jgi:hypothetical protein
VKRKPYDPHERRGGAGNWSVTAATGIIVERLGDSEPAWSVAFALVDTYQGSPDELCAVVWAAVA